MGQQTSIEWCDSSLNLEAGCDGCELWNRKANVRICYAGQLTERWGGKKGWPKTFEEPALFLERLGPALRWPDLTGKDRPDKPWLNGLPRLIFLNDMGDTFTESLPLDWLAPLFPAMADVPHQWLVLTKRANRMEEFSKLHPFPKNFWLMTSITCAANLNRIEHLMRCHGGSVRGISYEPAIEPVDFRPWLQHNPVDEMQAKRAVCVSSGTERGSRNQGRRHDLETTEARMGPLEAGSGEPTVQRGEGGARLRGILPGQNYDRQDQSVCIGAQASLDTLQRPDPGRANDQPSGWPEEAEPPRQFGTSDVFRTADSCDQGATSRTRVQSRRSEKRNGEAIRGTSAGNPATTSGGREINTDSEGFRRGVSARIEDLSRRQTLDLIIIGGESGNNARPFDVEWARKTIAQCKTANVACFMKQWGSNPVYQDLKERKLLPLRLKDSKGGDWDEWAAEFRVREFPK